MRIAYIDPRPVPGDSVEALQIAQNVDAFARTCAPLTLVTPQPADGVRIDDVLGRAWNPRVELAYVPDYRRRFFLPSRSNRMFIAAARRWIDRHRPDAVWLRHLRLADALVAMASPPPVFFETHELFARTLAEQPSARRRKVAALRALEQRVYARSRGIVVLTRALASDLIGEYVLTTPVLVAADGFDALLAAQATPPRRRDVATILYIGSLHPWKGVDVLVRAMREIVDARLVVVGGSPDAIEPLRELARREGVGERVEFAGAVPFNRRFDCIASADICALPLSLSSIASRYTSPLKLFEYLAAGKAVVATDLPSMREVVTHGVDAWLVEQPQPALYAAAINRLLADGALRARLGAAARETATRYTWDARGRAIFDFMTAHV
jgi:glycosyltransferase involved in cell wall biosynthesis